MSAAPETVAAEAAKPKRVRGPRKSTLQALQAREAAGYLRGLEEGKGLRREARAGEIAGQVVLLIGAFILGAVIF